MGAGAHLGIDLAEYDARIRTFIPDYELMHDVVADALRATQGRRTPTIVELGVGTGALAARCLEARPAARIIGIDEDAGMLEAARQRLAGRLRAIQGSFETVDLPPADAVVACLALHHVPPGVRRRRLFRRIRRALRPGGVLINADCFLATSRRIAAADRAAWIEHLERSYTTREVRGFFRRWAAEDHYVPLAEETAALQRAAFHVDVAFRRHSFAVVVAT